MKKIFLAFAVFAFVSFQGFAQWVDVTPPGTSGQRNLSVVSSQTAFLLFYGTSIFKRTTNGGNTWETKQLPDTLLWADGLIFINSDTGYVYKKSSSVGPQIYKTTDGAETWTNIPVPLFPASFILLHFFDSERGVLMLRTSPSDIMQFPPPYTYEVFTTQDGGQTWTAHDPLDHRIMRYHFEPDGSGIAFASDNNGLHTYKTTDFGASWELLDADEVAANWSKYRQFTWISGSYYINDTVGYDYYFENTTPYGPRLHYLTKTTDGGSTWANDGLVWLQGLFEGGMVSKDGTIWVFTGQYLFRNTTQPTNTDVANTNNQVSVTPTPLPTGSTFQLKMGSNFSGPVEVQIFHANGAAAQRLMTEVFEGESTLPLAALPAGLYFVTVKSENHGLLATGKLVVY